MSLTLDQICELAGVSLDRRCKVLYRLKKNYAHGIITLTEKGHCGSKRCSDVIMRADVAQSYLIQHRNRVKRSLRLLQTHGWMYFLKLKSLVRNLDGTYSCWTKVGETVDFLERKKKYKAVEEIEMILGLVPVHDRLRSEKNMLEEFAATDFLQRGRREYFLCPETRLGNLQTMFFSVHHKYITGFEQPRIPHHMEVIGTDP